MKIKVKGTRVGADGTGYYRGENGKYYYGNPQNGYLTETEEERKKRERKNNAQQSGGQQPTVRNYTGSTEGDIGGTELLGALTAVAVNLAAYAYLIVLAIAVVLFTILRAWPDYISSLVRDYARGIVDLGVILSTIKVVFVLAYFAFCSHCILARRMMRTKRYFIVSISALAVPYILGGIILFSPSVIWTGLNHGVKLTILPAFILCFFEHLVTKEQRGDNRWFITRIADCVCPVFIGQSKGLIGLGALAVLISFAMIKAGEALGSPAQIFLFTLVTGVLFIVLGIIGKRK